MELTDIQNIMDRFENSDIRELKIDNGDFHLYLSKNRLNQTTEVISDKDTEVESDQEKESIKENPSSEIAKDESLTPVKAPIVGVVYLQAKPGQPAFVKPGDHVKKGDTICIIEAMKMMTEVKSDVTGTVASVLVENEDLIEVGQPLIMVKED